MNQYTERNNAFNEKNYRVQRKVWRVIALSVGAEELYILCIYCAYIVYIVYMKKITRGSEAIKKRKNLKAT